MNNNKNMNNNRSRSAARTSSSSRPSSRPIFLEDLPRTASSSLSSFGSLPGVVSANSGNGVQTRSGYTPDLGRSRHRFTAAGNDASPPPPASGSSAAPPSPARTRSRRWRRLGSCGCGSCCWRRMLLLAADTAPAPAVPVVAAALARAASAPLAGGGCG